MEKFFPLSLATLKSFIRLFIIVKKTIDGAFKKI